ncbi:MAG TPA: hypothetical protein VG476_06985 [Acidimicrobiales bacterium]|nr:hypothetical protein [Acidimicrobiales bacterium]
MSVVPLSNPTEHSDDVDYTDEGVVFRSEGWYEVLLEVDWDPGAREGSRFSHTAIPGQEPLHSEAISGDVLADISGGKQRLRGNTIFGPDRTTSLVLEVWQNSGRPVDVRRAAITVRRLTYPNGSAS